MSIAKRLEEQKHYQDGLKKAIHYYDEQVIGLQDILDDAKESSLEEFKSLLEDLFFSENTKELIENCSDFHNSKKALIETFEAIIFYFHIYSLETILCYKFEPNFLEYLECNNLNTSFCTPRELFDVLQQLPPSVVEIELGDLCEERNSYMLLDSYKEKDKERFIQSFEKIPNNSEIMAHFRNVVEYENLIHDGKELIDIDPMTIPRHDVINFIESFRHDVEIFLRYCKSINFEYTKPLYDMPKQIFEGKPAITIQSLKNLYKEVIKDFIKSDDKFYDFEKNIIDNVIKESGFADLYNELYPQCLKEVQQDIIKEGGKTLEPIDFPEHLGIEPEKKESFLRALYKELVGKSYISPNREDDFVYLLGGPIARPDDLMPINWLKKFKYTSQAFFAAFCGKEFKSWTTLDAIATFKGEPLSHSNNLPDLYEHYEDRTRPFISIIEKAKKITEAQG